MYVRVKGEEKKGRETRKPVTRRGTRKKKKGLVGDIGCGCLYR